MDRPKTPEPACPSMIVLNRRPVAFVVGVQLQPHCVEDAKAADQTDPKYPREIPHEFASSCRVCYSIASVAVCEEITMSVALRLPRICRPQLQSLGPATHHVQHLRRTDEDRYENHKSEDQRSQLPLRSRNAGDMGGIPSPAPDFRCHPSQRHAEPGKGQAPCGQAQEPAMLQSAPGGEVES